MTVLEARSPAWHADRRTGIGSSDAPIVTGDSPWGDLLTLYAVKAGIIDEPEWDNPQTEWGRRLESVVADWFEERSLTPSERVPEPLKVHAVNRRLRHKQYAWMHASLDRRVVGHSALLECKTRRYPTDEWGAEDTNQIPIHYLVQVQHQLAVTGYDTAYVAVLFAGSEPRRYIVERDDELIAGLIDLEAAFMDCVRNGTPPDALMQSRRVRVQYREDELDADATLAMGIEGVYHLRTEIKGLKADEEKAAEAVKTLIGDHTVVRAGPFRATYKQNVDSHPVRWEYVAKAYRKWIEEDLDAGKGIGIEDRERLDAIESTFTETKPGLRLLRITKREETDA